MDKISAEALATTDGKSSEIRKLLGAKGVSLDLAKRKTDLETEARLVSGLVNLLKESAGNKPVVILKNVGDYEALFNRDAPHTDRIYVIRGGNHEVHDSFSGQAPLIYRGLKTEKALFLCEDQKVLRNYSLFRFSNTPLMVQ
mgnify:CR=1 FL=1